MGDRGCDEGRQRRWERVFRLALDETETRVRLYMEKLVSNSLGTASRGTRAFTCKATCFSLPRTP